MSRAHDLARAQADERHCLTVLHHEQLRVTRARRELQDAEAAEALANERHQEARAARKALERPEP